jgi:hypothetical protein
VERSSAPFSGLVWAGRESTKLQDGALALQLDCSEMTLRRDPETLDTIGGLRWRGEAVPQIARHVSVRRW